MKKNFRDESNLIDEISRATEGLVYVSEVDAEVLPFVSGGQSPDARAELLRISGSSGGEARVEEISFDEFFERLTAEREWFGEREKKRAEQFARLREVLRRNLSDLKVYRIGRVQIDIFVVGRDAAGRLAGVRTRAVET